MPDISDLLNSAAGTPPEADVAGVFARATQRRRRRRHLQLLTGTALAAITLTATILAVPVHLRGGTTELAPTSQVTTRSTPATLPPSVSITPSTGLADQMIVTVHWTVTPDRQ